MHVTNMHLAFLTSKSVTNHTTLGHRVLTIAQRHHQRMLRESAEIEAKREQARIDAEKLAEERRLAAVRVPMHPVASESGAEVLDTMPQVAQDVIETTAQAFEVVA